MTQRIAHTNGHANPAVHGFAIGAAFVHLDLGVLHRPFQHFGDIRSDLSNIEGLAWFDAYTLEHRERINVDGIGGLSFMAIARRLKNVPASIAAT